MKKVLAILLLTGINLFADIIPVEQIELKSNNFRTYLHNNGVFNQDTRTSNTPGLEWPINSGKFVAYTTGLCIGAMINGNIRLANSFYDGEYRPGYITDSAGHPVARYDNRFKFYKINKGDSYLTNPDWLNWGLMVPYGAPYTDVNNNGTFDFAIDTPGVKNAKQTVFVNMTDGYLENHSSSGTFGAGTQPLFAEVQLTAWTYDEQDFENFQFFRWVITNKNYFNWEKVYIALVSDCDLGNPEDDYIGSDSSLAMTYCYNADNMDGDGSGRSYGLNPPAYGICFLNCNSNAASMNYSHPFTGSPTFPLCEFNPSNSIESYNFLRGLKKDGTNWVIPNTNPPQITNFCFSGFPESNSGWTAYGGMISNCGGLLTGTHILPTPPRDERFVMSYGNDLITIPPGGKKTIFAAQFVGRGADNLASILKLRESAVLAQEKCSDITIGIQPVSQEVPRQFSLGQNFPNPFNPNTIIRFNIKDQRFTTLKIFDITGREVSELLNEELRPGTYEVNWNAANFPSGIYFYRLTAGDFTASNKMILVK